jgi:O-antigen/teichoic acid export membrane protein
MLETADPTTGAGKDAEPLERTARKALGWSFLNNVVGRVGTTLVGILLARVLVPEDYGIYAVALVVLNALWSVNELGVSLAVVRWPGDVSRIAPTVATLAFCSSAALWVAMFFCAPLVAQALNAPEALWIVRVLAIAILIDAVTAVPAALMTRAFMQRERMLVDTAGFVCSSATAISLALAGAGAWALVGSVLLGNLVNAAFILRCAPRVYAFGFDRRIARELLGFGLPLALASLLVIAMLNLDYVVIGATLGPVALGFYLLAFNLSAWPVNMFSAPARRISLPLFARLHNGETDASAAFVPVCTLLLLVTLPACLILAVFAEPLVRTLYGGVWLPAATVIPWLMVLAVARVMGELIYDFFVALGWSRTNLVVQAVWFATLLVVLPIAVHVGGIKGVAVGHASVALLVVGPLYAIALNRAGVSLRAMATQVARPLAGAWLAAAAGVGVVLLVGDNLVQLALGCIVVSVIYAACVYPMRTLLKGSAVLAGS